ncbi:unnamed protein product, partial [marine sediment metagenome]
FRRRMVSDDADDVNRDYIRVQFDGTKTFEIHVDNVSVKQISRNMGSQKTFDALDGVADGPDITPIWGDWDEQQRVTYLDGVYSVDWTGSAVDVLRKDSLFTEGDRIEFAINIIDIVGTFRFDIGYPLTAYISTPGVHIIRSVATSEGRLGIVANGNLTASFEILHTILTSPAQGRMTIEWTPMFDSTLVTSDSNVISVNGDDNDFLYLRTSNRMKFKDGSNEVTVTFLWVARTLYLITAQWGPHPDYANALKMQLIVTDGITT